MFPFQFFSAELFLETLKLAHLVSAKREMGTSPYRAQHSLSQHFLYKATSLYKENVLIILTQIN